MTATRAHAAFQTATRLACLMAMTAATLPAQAQAVYRSVGPDGRVTFSDQPPSVNAQPAARGGEAAGGPQLPAAMQAAVQRFPVTLYTGNGCQPCAAGRSLLQARGVPFRELIVSSEQDIEALRRIQGEAGLPLLTIGAQQVKGFASDEWTTFLDAAGYPKTSQLPTGYRNPAPAPLVAVTAAPPPPAPAAPPPLPPLGAPTPANPAGIRF